MLCFPQWCSALPCMGAEVTQTIDHELKPLKVWAKINPFSFHKKQTTDKQ
jgi:hypothetical protein